MTRCTFLAQLVCGWLLAAALLATPGFAADSQVGEVIGARLAALRESGELRIGSVLLGREDILSEFYARRGYAPAWGDPARVSELMRVLADSPAHGLDPADFFLAEIGALAPVASNPAAQADLDLLATAALIRYGYQRRFGKVDPAEMEPAWNFRRGFATGVDPVAALAQAVAAPSLSAYLDERIPGGPWYRQLQSALARYRAMAAAGGWSALPDGPVLRPGEVEARVPALRERLRIEGDLPATVPPPAAAELFDAALVDAVRSFQGRHGLAVDGQVGPGTRAAMNLPVDRRIDQLRMSLERVRWLSGEVPDSYVVVNVAGFRVGLVRNSRLVWNSRVVVGRAARQTPIFRDEMTYIELNPTWTVPPTILREDVLPKVKKDPGYLRRERISVIDRQGRSVDPYAVNWAAYSRAVPYTLRQEPGPANSLGRIKLMFPNPHAVYLHDTPARQLFDKPERTFSSGCIRVEDPLALAELVLDDPEWTRERLQAAIDTGETRRVSLRRPLPVLLVYLTAFADPDGTTRFFRDVYGRDDALLAALNGPVRLRMPGPSVANLGAASL